MSIEHADNPHAARVAREKSSLVNAFLLGRDVAGLSSDYLVSRRRVEQIIREGFVQTLALVAQKPREHEPETLQPIRVEWEEPAQPEEKAAE